MKSVMVCMYKHVSEELYVICNMCVYRCRG